MNEENNIRNNLSHLMEWKEDQKIIDHMSWHNLHYLLLELNAYCSDYTFTSLNSLAFSSGFVGLMKVSAPSSTPAKYFTLSSPR